MSVMLVGGMDRLEKHYIEEAEKLGISLKVFTRYKKRLIKKVRSCDAVVIFTNKVSHTAKREVMHAAKEKNIPVLMYHSCGLCTLRDCFGCLNKSDYLNTTQ